MGWAAGHLFFSAFISDYYFRVLAWVSEGSHDHEDQRAGQCERYNLPGFFLEEQLDCQHSTRDQSHRQKAHPKVLLLRNIFYPERSDEDALLHRIVGSGRFFIILDALGYLRYIR